MYNTQLLLVDDEISLLQMLQTILNKEGFQKLHTATTAEEALALCTQHSYDLILLDVMLPNKSGFDICPQIRQLTDAPIFFLTARSSDLDKLSGFALGADDYIEKPYDIEVLIAKIKGVFTRKYAVNEMVCGDIKINSVNHTIQVGDRTIETTAKEFELLKFLMENQGMTLRKEYLFNTIWGSDSDSEIQTLTVHIKWLRQKIEEDPKHPKHIITEWGVGYRFE